MKVFKQVSPRQIARYIKSFHQGRFMVEALGQFEFSDGVLAIETRGCHHTRALTRQINRAIRDLRRKPLLAE